jgi:hypothetical protein
MRLMKSDLSDIVWLDGRNAQNASLNQTARAARTMILPAIMININISITIEDGARRPARASLDVNHVWIRLDMVARERNRLPR